MKKFGLITVFAVAAITAHAQYLELNINSQCNPDIQTFTDGSNDTLGGTQFSVDATGMLPTPGNDRSSTYVVAVPEPTPYLMFGLGALVLAFGRWRALRSRGPRQ
jgi:hypothetical protein